MGQLPADAPCKAAHSSRNRARRMKAARAEARRLVDEARDKRDSALAELSFVKAELAKTKQEHERKCEEFKHKYAEMAAAVEAAADNAAAADEIENLKRINAETLEFLDSERSKTQALGKSLAQTQKARADAAAALEAVQANSESIKADLQAAREENHRQRHDYDQKIGELVRGQERLREQVQAAQGKLEEDAAEYEKSIAELQEALDSKQEEVNRAVSDSHKDELERLQKEVESERERADRAEGKARAVELLREDLESYKGKVGALRQQLSVCSNLKDDLEDAESKLMEATARATDAEGRARAAERDSSRLAKELERANMKLADESSRADGVSAALQEADGIKSLALPHGLLPGEVTTVAFGSGFQKFLVKKLIYKSDGSILAENEHGQSVSMGVWR